MLNWQRLFNYFYFLLLIFFWQTALFWFDSLSFEKGDTNILLYVALVGVELLASYMIIAAQKEEGRKYGIHRLCLYWEIMMLVVLIFNHASVGHFPKCLAWPLLFEASYYFAKKNLGIIRNFRRLNCFFLLIGLYVFLGAMVLKQFASQSNMIYFLLLPVPVALLQCDRKWQLRILFATTFFALLSMKRSMMLAVFLFWTIYGAKYMFVSGKKRLAIVLSIVFLIVGYGTIKVVDNISGGGLSSRTVDYEKKDISNGREAIYLVTLDMIVRSSPIHLILGNGHNAVRSNSPMEISAHNEFLEIIYDYGVIVLFLYLCLWAYVIKQWWYHYRNDTEYFVPYTLSLCFFAVMAMVSQLVLYVSYFLYLVIFWGIVEAAKDNRLLKTE